jgi:hypothetical protein
MSEAGDLLRRSRAAHAAHYQAARHWTGQEWQVGDLAVASQCFQDALDLRTQAEEVDPEYADPEWQNDTARHADLVAFYQDYLGRQAVRVEASRVMQMSQTSGKVRV